MQDPSSQSTSARETRKAEGRSATATATQLTGTHGEAETRRAGATTEHPWSIRTLLVLWRGQTFRWTPPPINCKISYEGRNS
eukprot:2845947-Prymnesium_polylepis.4